MENDYATDPGTGARFSRADLKNLDIYDLAMLYKAIFNDSPHCHMDSKIQRETIYDAIMSGEPQKIDPEWD